MPRGLFPAAVQPWWVVELMITKWVGTERGTYGPFLHPPRCHRACGFHRTRRPPIGLTTPVRVLLASAWIPRHYHPAGLLLGCQEAVALRHVRGVPTLRRLWPR